MSDTRNTGAPKIIYLQDGDPDDPDFEPLSDYEGVTWCKDSINDGDTKYIRFDEHERELAAALKDAERYRWLVGGCRFAETDPAWDTKESLDAAIDAALAGKEEV